MFVDIHWASFRIEASVFDVVFGKLDNYGVVSVFSALTDDLSHLAVLLVKFFSSFVSLHQSVNHVVFVTTVSVKISVS